ncbi:cellulase family glycosylhydrolase [Actinoplanes oblitus]|uniref:Cellulase family glycosylhydrolase n=1 Tax=Actinoplanes oblitus TaxID=3040509 RepID=A0ABY8WR56_9ACTN|nr:cellulase family glycosylhydrolase [Actinoplanes oblitus]WIM99335.1 cellulase family glycosylhydrolase [Actinoplanes oblitus]
MTGRRIPKNRALALSCLLAAGVLVPQAPAAADPGSPDLAGRLAAVRTARTINYYPSDAGWSAMWTRFDPVRVDEDLARAAELGADNVRVVVFPRVFGFPEPEPEYLGKLDKFVSIADSHGMTVKLTLFDWWSRYKDTRGSATWANAVIGRYADDPRVLTVELKNELSPDDQPAIQWVRRLIPQVRVTAPAMPLTVSVNSGPSGLARLRRQLADTPLDYYDYHFYGPSEQAFPELEEVSEVAAPDPVVIGETGLSTAASTPGEQAAYLARVFRAAAAAGVRSVAPWTLTDFAAGAIPSNAAVSLMPAQYRYGLYRTDGTPKPAASVVRAAWSGTDPAVDVLDLGFEGDPADSPWRDNLPEFGTAEPTGETAHDGRRSVRFSGTGRDRRGLPSLRISPITPIRPGQPWHAAAWARGENATGVTEIALSWFDAAGRWIGQDVSGRLPRGTTDWTELSVDAVAPPAAAGLQLHLKSGDNAGTTWFDDVTLGQPAPAGRLPESPDVTGDDGLTGGGPDDTVLPAVQDTQPATGDQDVAGRLEQLPEER